MDNVEFADEADTRDRCYVLIVKSMACVDLQAAGVRKLCGVNDSLQLFVPLPLDPALGVMTGMQLDDGGAAFDGRFYLLPIGTDEQRNSCACIGKPFTCGANLLQICSDV